MALLPDSIPAGPVELRRWRPADAQAVLDAVTVSLAELRLWMPWARNEQTPAAYADVLRGFDASFEAGREFGFGMYEPGDTQVVGACGLHLEGRPGFAEIGYWVRTDRHRRGYATAAARALTTVAFERLPGIDEVHITMDAANLASAGVPARLGYLAAAEEDREILADGHTGRGLRWVMRRDCWE